MRAAPHTAAPWILHVLASRRRRFGVAVVLSVASYGLTSLLLTPLAGASEAFLLLAVTLSAAAGGTGPGLLSVAVCSAAYVALQRTDVPSFWADEAYEASRTILFVLIAAVDALGVGSLRRAWFESRRLRREGELLAAEHSLAARLGLEALQARDMSALVSDTAHVVRRALRCEAATVLEMDGGELVVRAAAGLARPLLGRRFPAASCLAAALSRVEPLTCGRDEPSNDPVLSDLRLHSSALVAIPGGTSQGLLCAYASRPAAFDAPELRVLRSAAQVLGVAAVRMQLEERVRENLELLRAITANIAEGVLAVDSEGRLTFMNPAAERMLGWTESELKGRQFHDIVHPPTAAPAEPSRECRLLEVLRTGGSTQGQDESYARRDGSRFPIAFTSGAIKEDGTVVGAVLAFQDFTEHERAERAERFLAQAGQQLSLSLDWGETLQRVIRLSVPTVADWCAVVVLDEEGRPRGVGAESGDPAHAALSRELLEQYSVDLDARHGIGRVLRTGEPELIPDADPAALVAPDEASAAARTDLLRRVGVRSFMAVPLTHAGRVLGAMAFGLTTRERRFSTDDLALAMELGRRCAVALENARLYREAQEATRTREEVLSIISHDLQTPLGAVRLGVGLMRRLVQRGAREPEITRTAETIERAAHRLGRLVQDLVDFARMERGRLTIRSQPEEAIAIISEALEVVRPIAEENGIALTVELPSGLRRVACDRDRIMQVLQNLIGNALKVVPPGGVVGVRAEVRGDELVLSVSDVGPGIPEEDLPRVFDRFWRGKRVAYEGSGLGLAIARGIIEAHGGRIWVDSQVGRGTTFSFTLPLTG